jgi:hypothetical protein
MSLRRIEEAKLGLADAVSPERRALLEARVAGGQLEAVRVAATLKTLTATGVSPAEACRALLAQGVPNMAVVDATFLDPLVMELVGDAMVQDRSLAAALSLGMLSNPEFVELVRRDLQPNPKALAHFDEDVAVANPGVSTALRLGTWARISEVLDRIGALQPKRANALFGELLQNKRFLSGVLDQSWHAALYEPATLDNPILKKLALWTTRLLHGGRIRLLFLVDRPWLTDLPEGLAIDGNVSIQDCRNFKRLPERMTVAGRLTVLGCMDWDGKLPKGCACAQFRCYACPNGQAPEAYRKWAGGAS